MEYKFFSEYAVLKTPDIPLVTNEDELVWMVDSEEDGFSIAEKVLAKEFGRRGAKLLSIRLKRRLGEPMEWQTVKTFAVHQEHEGNWFHTPEGPP